MRRLRSIDSPHMAALACAVFGLFTHLFGLANALHNIDDIAQQPSGYGTGVTSGRWLLSLLGDLAVKLRLGYNLPTVIGLLFILLIACSAGLMVSVFGIRSRKKAALIGMLFIAFPSAFSTLSYRYTAAYYALALFLSVLAVWVLPRYRFGFLLSSLCISCSLGIYQAYVPLTIGIFVLLLLQQALGDDAELKGLIRSAVRYCAVLILGLLLYYLFLNITLKLYGTELSTYHGVNEMGKISLKELPELIHQAVYSVLMLPFKDYCGVATSPLVRCSYLLLGVVSALLIGYICFRKKKKIGVLLFTALLFLVFPVAVNFIVVMCPVGLIYTLMVYSFVLLASAPLILLECLPEKQASPKGARSVLTKCVCLLIAVIISFYAYETNVNYMALYFYNRQAENYLSSLVVQARMTGGFHTDLEWAFLGKIQDPLLGSYWQYEHTYGGIEKTQSLVRRYSWPEWIHNYYGYEVPTASTDRVTQLSRMDEVRAMPCWPNDGSIRIVDGTLVIKFEELS